MTGGRIFQLAMSRGGVPKLPMREARLTTLGLEGDHQAHPKFHGGPERAVCLFALEVIERLQAEGHPIYPGSTGENVTVRGLDWSRLAAGTRLALGDGGVLEITGPATPCKQITGSFADGRSTRISEKVHPGESRLYARVVCEGILRVAQPVRLL